MGCRIELGRERLNRWISMGGEGGKSGKGWTRYQDDSSGGVRV